MIKIKEIALGLLYFVLVGYFIISCFMVSKGIADGALEPSHCDGEQTSTYRYEKLVPAYKLGCWLGEPV